MEQRQGAFPEVERVAQRLLLDRLPPATMPVVVFKLVLSVQPAFDQYYSWAIFAHPDNADIYCRKSVWNRPFDVARFIDPLQGLKYGWHLTPTLSSELRALRESSIMALLDKAGGGLERPGNLRGIVIDGTRWLVDAPNLFAEGIVEWPEGVRKPTEFERWAYQLRDTLDAEWILAATHRDSA